MKYLILALLLTSCGTKRKFVNNKQFRCVDCSHRERIQDCMSKFAEKGYDSEALVRICGKIYERRD